MEKIKIVVWLKKEDLEQFKKEWKYLFEAQIYYSQNKGSFKYNGVPLYLHKINSSGYGLIQLQLDIEDYDFWIENTKTL